MSFDLALRLTEVLLALAFIQQSAEHLAGAKDERALFLPRLVLSGLLLVGFYRPVICALLAVHALFILHRFQGPYNGGSDRMGLLILFCVTLAHVLPSERWQEVALGYLALQLILSYFISGYVKIINPEWRSGQALQDVFSFSAYPASEALRGLAHRSRLLCAASWAVIGFELVFPLALLSEATLMAALLIAALFHLANAFLFGLNRFFWVWLAAYPSILWLQDRIF